MKHPLFNRYDLDTRNRIMVTHLEKQITKLRDARYDTRPAVHWLNDILPLIRIVKYEKDEIHLKQAEKELKKHWIEFITVFLDDFLV